MFKKHKKLINDTQAIDLTTVNEPNSIISEQFKTIRTNIVFSASDIKTLMVTSSLTGEGKSTIVANLAVEFANNNKNVLLIDADMRRPTVHKTFGINNIEGLSTLLTKQRIGINSCILKSKIERLNILPSGPIPPNPAELLSSKDMVEIIRNARKVFDVVLLDCPPILPVTDARILAPLVDGTILVVRRGGISKKIVRESKSVLEQVRANLLGAVLNGFYNKEIVGYYGETYGSYSTK
ncbi:CpsD/CapB family tyrosine-protein kinase [Lactiplantibacillus plantarum]|uniref:CpsD/CapB family tyrosine-protein kinase n=1 Tax=Lactiplantibacillus plantarum TaxID=1590 RepID=UPI0009764F91|nr:CpsD/CapB family tyrosine-protein kinase [Lactiplantibacillus plantarum]MCK8475403.1 CpsD/CapB family tyrosine-protein kinase [Lactiplantibacillus plantarum]RDD75139.1 exopolysaccharide biosynthesis protein [Lactiplantibacillus plantarum]